MGISKNSWFKKKKLIYDNWAKLWKKFFSATRGLANHYVRLSVCVWCVSPLFELGATGTRHYKTSDRGILGVAPLFPEL